MITSDNETYVPTKDPEGNDYFCPASLAAKDGGFSPIAEDACIEAEVAGRYAGIMTTNPA